MTILLDDLGGWTNLGTITPDYFEWEVFPVLASQGYSLFRFTYQGDISEIKKYLYSPIRFFVRPIYQFSTAKQIGQTVKLYPKEEVDIVTIPMPNEIYSQKSRAIEITKGSKYWNNAAINSINISVTCEEFVPYEETLALLTQATLSQNVIEQIAEAVVTRQYLLPP